MEKLDNSMYTTFGYYVCHSYSRIKHVTSQIPQEIFTMNLYDLHTHYDIGCIQTVLPGVEQKQIGVTFWMPLVHAGMSRKLRAPKRVWATQLMTKRRVQSTNLHPNHTQIRITHHPLEAGCKYHLIVQRKHSNTGISQSKSHPWKVPRTSLMEVLLVTIHPTSPRTVTLEQ